jgi:hypothetical protein
VLIVLGWIVSHRRRRAARTGWPNHLDRPVAGERLPAAGEKNRLRSATQPGRDKPTVEVFYDPPDGVSRYQLF